MKTLKDNVFVISDLHLGHDKILEYCRPWFKTIQEHDDYIIEQIKELHSDVVLYILGDVAFTKDALKRLNEADCHKVLIGGNHDNFKPNVYYNVFNNIKGVAQFEYREKKVVLTHIPVHIDQMSIRWDYNIHGHLHTYHVDDERYYNVSCEVVDFKPKKLMTLLDELIES